MTDHPLEWIERAACAGLPTALFFPEPGRPAAASDPVTVCRSCPVSDDCLAYALEARIEHGIYGGLNAVERRRHRRRVLKAARSDRLRHAAYDIDARPVRSRTNRSIAAEHGSRSAYVGGCRCDACTTAERLYSRSRNRRRTVPPADLSAS